MKDQKMDTVCEHYQIDRPKHHNALDDTRDLVKCLLQHSGKTERSKTFLKKLLERTDFYVETDRWSYGGNRPEYSGASNIVVTVSMEDLELELEKEFEALKLKARKENNERLKREKESNDGINSVLKAIGTVLFIIFAFTAILVIFGSP